MNETTFLKMSLTLKVIHIILLLICETSCIWVSRIHDLHYKLCELLLGLWVLQKGSPSLLVWRWSHVFTFEWLIDLVT